LGITALVSLAGQTSEGSGRKEPSQNDLRMILSQSISIS
jgi:hypothetical protein